MTDIDPSPELTGIDASPIETKKTSWVTKQFAPGSLADETGYASKYFNLDIWHYLIIIGIAVSGLAAFVNTYDAISGINANMQACSQTDVLQKELNTQFIVLLALSCFAVLLGLILAWFFRKQDNQRRLITLGIITIGIFGILYALTIRFQYTSNTIKLFASWITFLGFLVLGWFLSQRAKNVKVHASITWD